MLGRLTFWLAVLVMTLGPAGAAEVAVEKCDLFSRQGGDHTYRIPGLVMTLDGTLLTYACRRTARCIACTSEARSHLITIRLLRSGGHCVGEIQSSPVAANPLWETRRPMTADTLIRGLRER